MNKVLACFFLFIGTAHGGEIARSVARFPDVPAPPQGETQWIARSMRMNGLPMTIQALYSHSSPEEIARFYDSWAKGLTHLQTRRWRTRNSEMLSIRSASFLITMELQQVVSGTQGTVVTSAPPERTKLNTDTNFPHPASWRVANLQQYEDGDKAAEQITFTSMHGPASEACTVNDVLAADGWTVLTQQNTRANDYVIEAQRNSDQARVVIADDVEHRVNTRVTVLWIKG